MDTGSPCMIGDDAGAAFGSSSSAEMSPKQKQTSRWEIIKGVKLAKEYNPCHIIWSKVIWPTVCWPTLTAATAGRHCQFFYRLLTLTAIWLSANRLSAKWHGTKISPNLQKKCTFSFSLYWANASPLIFIFSPSLCQVLNPYCSNHSWPLCHQLCLRANFELVLNHSRLD